MKYKKAQEEITGFVVIVVLVAIILLVFLAILVRQPANQDYKDVKEISEFLRGSFEYTTECAISYEPDYSKLGELFRECHSGRICKSGKSACKVLNDTISNLIEVGWQVGEQSPVKGYKLDAEYSVNASKSTLSDAQIMALAAGNCSSNIRGAEEPISDPPGAINVRVTLCY